MLRYCILRNVPAKLFSRMCASDMPSTSKCESDSFGLDDGDKTCDLETTPKKRNTKRIPENSNVELLNTKRRIRKWKNKTYTMNTEDVVRSGPYKLSDEEFQQCVEDEERDWDNRAQELVEMLSELTTHYDESLPDRVPKMTEDEIELKKKTGKVKFRSISYTEGELDNSDLSKPPSRDNPHPFNPDDSVPPVYSRTIAPYVNHVPLLQTLVDLGVNLFEIDTTTQLSRHLIRLDKDKDVKPKLQWLVSVGFEPSDLGEYITRNPFFLIQNLDDMKARYNYLESKRFTKAEIVKIVKEFRYWLNVDVKTMDARLGWIQKQFGLSGNDVRKLIVKEARIVMFGLGPLQRLVNMFNKELLFSPAEIKQMLLMDPRLFMMDAKYILNNYYYIYRVMQLSNKVISENPFILRCSLSSIKSRHEFLRKLSRNFYEGQRVRDNDSSKKSGNTEVPDQDDDVEREPIALQDFLHPSDVVFAKKTANTYLAVYNKFLRSH